MHIFSSSELEEWMPLLGYKTDSMLNPVVHNGLSTRQIIPENQILQKDSLSVVPGLSCLAQVTRSNFLHLSTIPELAVKRESTGKHFKPFPQRVAAVDSFVGSGVILSSVGNRAVVRSTQSADSIIKDVILSVFNNSNFINIHFSSNTQESFFFCKSDVNRINEDMHQLQRLGSLLNVTKNIPKDGVNQLELIVRSEHSNLNIRYGTDVKNEIGRVTRLARHRAVQRAWAQEKRLVRQGNQGRRHWTKSESEQLFRKGSVKGYTGVTVHSIEDYPTIADDPTNIMIQKTSNSNRAHRPKSR